ncbi:hypothetical protein MUK70_21095 [Dyadobacter chenwenxiniae]|uniref:Uncharacterized protein n=1 Tax=Dyadobacter chenwenxiniae TaxID=2906456 RepID=A0A9X1PIP9_9BACT|nr:hypothetical protein [Dyadobacter chenwenxiniae]MCF0061740.1 hypothetical protein [Dyadobacter chenwenxiniae]UON81558.1 hypothetical protein MUK70_21095 [Dyadobacter chenwenxiniae]
MQTQPNSDESLDSRHLSYGREVAELLSQSSPASWMNDLWDIYSGYMAAQTELGHSRRANDIFTSFKELLFFFQRVGEMKK